MMVFYCLIYQNTELPSAPIEIKSVDVTTSLPGCTNVTVTFVAKENIQVVWTVHDGFLPQGWFWLATSLKKLLIYI